MEIISIDVHAKKNSLVFDGEQIRNYNVADLRSYVKSIKAGKEQVIIILNAPLTGYVEEFDKVTAFSPTVIRGIEYFFSQKEFGYSMTRVPGVNITAYSSLAYWTIVQNVFHLNLARGIHGTKFVPVFGKERLGLNKSGLNNLMHKAEREGRDRSMVKGGLRNYMNSLWAKNQTADNIKVYGENIFVFDGKVLITLYPLPKKFRKHLSL